MSFFKKHLFSHNKDYQMAWFISLLIGVEGLVMTLICLKEGNLRMVLISASYAFAMLGTFVYINLTKPNTVKPITDAIRQRVSGIVMIMLCFFLFDFL